MTRHGNVHENHDCQRELAASLISAVGMEGAVKFALENLWYGVLDQLHLLKDEG